MDRNERLLGPEPTKQFIKKTKATLDALFKLRVEQQNARLKQQRSLTKGSFIVLRNLVKDDPKSAAALQSGRAQFLARTKKRSLRSVVKRGKVKPNVRLGSLSATFVPPYALDWTSEWGQSGDTQANYGADGNRGEINMYAATGDGGGSTNVACALGNVFQPPAGDGILQIFSTPGYAYDLETWYWFDYANAGGFFGIYVGEYTLDGMFVQTVLDQQISFAGLGDSSGFPLIGFTAADSTHLYAIWVWAGVSVSGDGLGEFSGSYGSANVFVSVPSISIFYF
jgi:hypothetical protein